MTEDQAENAVNNDSPGSMNWIRGMKIVINLEAKKIKRLENKWNKKDIDKEQIASLSESMNKNIQLLKTHW